jgi:molybdopterin/thiamine biosynthesis adenylyltransferase
VAELADALDLGSSIERCGGSSPPSRTIPDLGETPFMDPRKHRYDRQQRLPQIGASGQAALAEATVTIIGLGALGSVAADLLARAGVGTLVLIDRDVVEWSNLQRQMLYCEADAQAALPKVEAAVARLRSINSQIQYRVHASDLTAGNVNELLRGVDLLLDGTDNFGTRYLLNDFAVSNHVPYVYAGVVATYGMVGSIVPPDGPCLRCTYPEPPDAAMAPTCRSAGVLGPAVSVIAGLATAIAMKILTGGEAMAGFQHVDLWNHSSQLIRAARDPECACCGQRDFPWLAGSRGSRGAEVLCGGDAVQVPASGGPPDLMALADKLAETVSGLQSGLQFLRFQSAGLDVVLFADGRALVRGTEDPGRARAVLADTIGG